MINYENIFCTDTEVNICAVKLQLDKEKLHLLPPVMQEIINRDLNNMVATEKEEYDDMNVFAIVYFNAAAPNDTDGYISQIEISASETSLITMEWEFTEEESKTDSPHMTEQELAEFRKAVLMQAKKTINTI